MAKDSTKSTQSLRSFDSNEDTGKNTDKRRDYLADQIGVNLDAVKNQVIVPGSVTGKNIENLVGEVAIPLGVAGPVAVNGMFASGQYYIPCATTEGALVASISRGCKALLTSGGATTVVAYDGITRAPLFVLNTVNDAKKAETRIKTSFTELQKIASTTSSHTALTSIETFSLGKYLWVRLTFDTQEAMGMNMVSTASEKICDYITNDVDSCRLIALSGNMCVDKKANTINIVKGRGYRVTAECVLPEKVINDVLHTTSKQIAEVGRAKNWYGSALGGSISSNAQAANIVAATFIATGQDPAHVIESSQAFTIAEEVDGGLYISVTLPNVICGTIGGGTGLPTQKAAMSAMINPVFGTNGKSQTNDNMTEQFVEVLSAGVLAGELSLMAALCTNTLASAHHELTGKGA